MVAFPGWSSMQRLKLSFKELCTALDPEGQASEDDDVDERETFSCPITKSPFVDPVVCADGETYERAAIARVIRDAKARGVTPMSPLQRVPLTEVMIPNRIVLRHLPSMVRK